MQALAGWFDTLDVEGAATKIASFGTLVFDTFGFIRDFVSGKGASQDIGWLETPAAKIAEFILWAQVAGVRIRDTFAYIRGYISGEGANVDIGWLEGPAEAIGGAFIAIQAAGRSFAAGDMSGSLSSIGASLSTLAPAAQEFGAQLPKIGGAIATLAGAGLGLLTNVLSFLADHVDTIIQFMPLIVAGFIAWRVAAQATAGVSIALRTAELLAIPAQITRNVLRLQAARLEYQMAGATVTNTAAQNGQVATMRRGIAATILSKGVMMAARGATLVAAAAQWILNAALSANPIALVVLAIAALVAGIVWIATQTTIFQDAWAFMTAAVAAGWNWLWTVVLQPVFAAIGAVFTWLYNNVIAPIIIAIALSLAIFGAIVGWLWNVAVMPAINAIGAVFTWLWVNVVSPVFAAIGAIFMWIWNSIIMPVVMWISAGITAVGTVVNWLWVNVVAPAFAAIGAIFMWIWNSIIMPVVNWISTAITATGIVISYLYATYVQPTLNAVGAMFMWVWNSIVMPVANWIRGAIDGVGQTVSSVFGGIAGAVGSAFSGALNAAKQPINALIGLINGAISAINGISVTIPDFIPGIGGQSFSPNLPKIPRLARGGNVAPRRGGTLAVLGEAGRSETVTDLGNTNRLIAATTELVERDGGGGGEDNSIHFHGPVTTADPRELTKQMSKKMRARRLAKSNRPKVTR
jgi:hypothetical protein